jgi:hypothetical protein
VLGRISDHRGAVLIVLIQSQIAVEEGVGAERIGNVLGASVSVFASHSTLNESAPPALKTEARWEFQ